MQITFDKVSKTYDHDSIVEEMSLTFAEHQTTVIIGPSGCGKSTLLRLIIGLVTQTSGTIYFDHQEITQINVNQWRQQIGYMTQDGGLFPHLSARQNITLMANFLSYQSGWIENRIQDLCELVRLPSRLLSQYPSELSGGQRQRVSLMRALLLDPSCLLLDEPLGALDPITRHELQSELKHIFLKLQKTILLVTHDMREAAYFGDDILLMRSGHIVQRGSFRELSQHPIEPFVSEFIRLQQFPVPSEQELLV
jgi:osmoprotectant transport system ATP-binding protein